MGRQVCLRKTTKLSDASYRMLEAYGLAASAAGVGVLAMASAAEAEIIYTPVHVGLKPGSHYNLDLNHDGTVDFTLHNGKGTSKSPGVLSVIPAAGNGAVGFETVSGGPLASAMQRGSTISGRYFPGKIMAFVATTSDGSVFYGGSWLNVKNRYLGLHFKMEGKYHFGWARLSVQVANRKITGTLTGYAYETIANKPIVAGKEKGPDVATMPPDRAPGTLGSLALGRK